MIRNMRTIIAAKIVSAFLVFAIACSITAISAHAATDYRLVEKRIISAEGQREEVIRYSYDDSGVLRTTISEGGDVAYEGHYDEYGHLMETVLSWYASDFTYGVPYKEGTERQAVYDDLGHLQSFTVTRSEMYADKEYQVYSTYEYDQMGRICSVTERDNYDETVAGKAAEDQGYTRYFTYSDDGYSVRGTSSNNNTVYTIDTTYNNAGQMLSYIMTEERIPNDESTKPEKPDIEKSGIIWEYDNEGRLERKVRFTEKQNYSEETEYVYHYHFNNGRVDYCECSTTGLYGDTNTSIMLYEYDDAGNLVKEFDGRQTTLYFYEPAGKTNTSKPTASPTAIPLGDAPSAADLDAIGAEIRYPRKESYYLENYVYTTVKQPKCYAFLDPNAKDVMAESNRFTVENGEAVIILAKSSGYACVIFPDLYKAGWINEEHLN